MNQSVRVGNFSTRKEAQAADLRYERKVGCSSRVAIRFRLLDFGLLDGVRDIRAAFRSRGL